MNLRKICYIFSGGCAAGAISTIILNSLRKNKHENCEDPISLKKILFPTSVILSGILMYHMRTFPKPNQFISIFYPAILGLMWGYNSISIKKIDDSISQNNQPKYFAIDVIFPILEIGKNAKLQEYPDNSNRYYLKIFNLNVMGKKISTKQI